MTCDHDPWQWSFIMSIRLKECNLVNYQYKLYQYLSPFCAHRSTGVWQPIRPSDLIDPQRRHDFRYTTNTSSYFELLPRGFYMLWGCEEDSEYTVIDIFGGST